MANSDKLHLPDLTIKGFRGIDELTIRKLGRVTLLAGKNGVGKTTVLEAVRVYAARGHHSVLSSLLRFRNEFSLAIDKDANNFTSPDLTTIFYDRTLSPNACVSIGPANGGNDLKIECVSLDCLSDSQTYHIVHSIPDHLSAENFQVLRVMFQKKEQIVPWLIFNNEMGNKTENRIFSKFGLQRLLNQPSNENIMPQAIGCELLGPDSISNENIARFWNNVFLTDDEIRAVRALRLIFGDVVDRVGIIADETPHNQRSNHPVMVKLKHHGRPVPLRSLGDGATRLFTVALALANSRDGFLLIDEAENGIHHTVQADYWRMVLQTSQEYNVQVLATTHSWDCVRGFAQAATESEEVEGVLVRLERDEDGLYTVEYSEERLQTAAEHDIEVR